MAPWLFALVIVLVCAQCVWQGIRLGAWGLELAAALFLADAGLAVYDAARHGCRVGAAARAYLRAPRGLAALSVMALFVLTWAFAERTPSHLSIVSSGSTASLAVDGELHPFTWPVAPSRIELLLDDPAVHEWGIDGSQSLTLSIASLDPTYLRDLQSNPYIAMDRRLRDEGGYSRWRNVRLSTALGGRDVSTSLDAAHGYASSLGSRFRFDADMARLEQPMGVRFTAGSGAYTLSVDRSNRVVQVVATQPGFPDRTLGSWYFPGNPRPYLALNIMTIAYAVGWSIVVSWLTFLLAWAARSPCEAFLRAARPRRAPLDRVLPAVILVCSFAWTLFIALHDYRGLPHIVDANAYYFQSKMLALGRLSLPVPPDVGAFTLPFFGEVGDRWMPQYLPGTALFLAPGMLAGVPWLIQPVLGVCTLGFVYGIGLRQYGRRVALIALLLGALSPFYSFMIGSYMSHPEAAFCLALSYYLLVRSEWGRRAAPCAAAGAALGLCLLVREATALLALPLLALYLLLSLWERRPRSCDGEGGVGNGSQEWVRHWLPLALFLAAFACFVVLIAAYDWRFTGHIGVSPRSILNPSDQFGFGVGKGWWGRHTLAAGLVNLDQLLTGLILDLYGWPYYMALAIPLLPFVFGYATRPDALNGVLALCLTVGMVGYFYHGIALGPRYLYETIPMLLLLTGRGIDVLGELAGDRLAALGVSRAGGRAAAGAVLGLLILPDLLFYLPRQQQLYDNYTALTWRHDVDIPAIRAEAPRDAIVVTSESDVYGVLLCSFNDPRVLLHPATTRGDVWAVGSSADDYRRLMAAYPHRLLYRLLLTPTTQYVRIVLPPASSGN